MSPDELGRRVWELRGPLMRLACAIVRRQQDAEDAVSEAVVRAFESLPALRCDAAVRPWLIKITARCCYDRLRRLRRETPCEDPEPLCAPVEPHGDGTLADLIAQLPAGQREAITLYYYEGFSAQEVAQALGVPRPTACMRLSRGRKRLRWLIETEGRKEPRSMTHLTKRCAAAHSERNPRSRHGPKNGWHEPSARGKPAPRLMPGRRGSAIRLPSSGRGRNGRLRISRADVSPA